MDTGSPSLAKRKYGCQFLNLPKTGQSMVRLCLQLGILSITDDNIVFEVGSPVSVSTMLNRACVIGHSTTC